MVFTVVENKIAIAVTEKVASGGDGSFQSGGDKRTTTTHATSFQKTQRTQAHRFNVYTHTQSLVSNEHDTRV